MSSKSQGHLVTSCFTSEGSVQKLFKQIEGIGNMIWNVTLQDEYSWNILSFICLYYRPVGLSQCLFFFLLKLKSFYCISGAFLIPFVIMLFITGIPLVYLELSFGQFASSGVVSIWKASPLFEGKWYRLNLLRFLLTVFNSFQSIRNSNFMNLLACCYLYWKYRREDVVVHQWCGRNIFVCETAKDNQFYEYFVCICGDLYGFHDDLIQVEKV